VRAAARGGIARGGGGAADAAGAHRRPGQPLLVDPVRSGRPARRGAADRGRARPLGDLLQPGRPRPAERVVVPPLHGIGPVGARLHRGPAGPRRPRHVLLDPRRRAVALGRRPAALAGRGHAPRLVLPHPAEVPRAPRPARDRPAPGAGRTQRRRVLLRPEGHRELGGADRLASPVGVRGPRPDLVRRLPRPEDPQRADLPGDRAGRGLDRRVRGDRLRLRALPHAGQARPGLAVRRVERGDLRHDPEPLCLRQRKGRVHAVRRGQRQGRGRAPRSACPGDRWRGGPADRLPLVLGRGRGNVQAHRTDAALRQRRVVRAVDRFR
jgi:hypothetical protein